jgi:acyl carrier protein phosphodiesterase
VIIDIFYDHFLAVHWNRFSSEKLIDFASQSYDTLIRHHSIMPERSAFVLKYMKSGDWLSSYQTIQGIEQVMGGMARRARYESKMETSHRVLEQHYQLFSREFLDYFPELMHFTKSNFPGPHHF